MQSSCGGVRIDMVLGDAPSGESIGGTRERGETRGGERGYCFVSGCLLLGVCGGMYDDGMESGDWGLSGGRRGG